MWIKCVIKGGNTSITIGKLYQVVEEQLYNYIIVNDAKETLHYSKGLFEEASNLKLVRCTRVCDFSDLTAEKEYRIVDEDDLCYKLIDDANELGWYDKDLFSDFLARDPNEEYLICMQSNLTDFTKDKLYLIQTTMDKDMFSIKSDRGFDIVVATNAGGFAHHRDDKPPLSESEEGDTTVCLCPSCGKETVSIEVPLEILNEMVTLILRKNMQATMIEEKDNG